MKISEGVPVGLGLLVTELENIGLENLIEPPDKSSRDDHFVGEMSFGMKRLYTYAQMLRNSAARLGYEAEMSRNRSETAKLQSERMKTLLKANVLMDIFWLFLKEEFEEQKLWERDKIGIRKGFLVVWGESSEPTIGDILGRLGL